MATGGQKSYANSSSAAEMRDDNHSSSFSGSLAESAAEEGVEDEKCVVAQYRTTREQREIFVQHLETCTKDRIPVEWVIDIADETNGWFYGTAYHFDDVTHMLHVMVPDKQNPSFDGNVLLDYRTVHLIECADGKTDALFNKIVRDSVVKVRWEVDWFEEDSAGESVGTGTNQDQNGRWVLSAARYYLRISNQMLVEDSDFGVHDSRGFVMLTADINVRLKQCLKGKGQEYFDRLVTDGTVLSSPEVLEAAKISIIETANASNEFRLEQRSDGNSHNDTGEGVSVRRLADMSRGLKECLADLLDDREKTYLNRSVMARSFKQFTMDGDLDAGLSLLADAEEVILIEEKKKSNGNKKPKDESELLVNEAWMLAQTLQKSAMQLLKAGGDTGSNATEEFEFLKKSQMKMKRELEEKERELQSLYASQEKKDFIGT
jgi:hypothetical protein